MIYQIIGTVLFLIAMFFLVRYALRKGERDWEYIQESNRKHAEWMVEHGRSMERFEQRLKNSAPTWAIDYNWD